MQIWQESCSLSKNHIPDLAGPLSERIYANAASTVASANRIINRMKPNRANTCTMPVHWHWVGHDRGEALNRSTIRNAHIFDMSHAAVRGSKSRNKSRRTQTASTGGQKLISLSRTVLVRLCADCGETDGSGRRRKGRNQTSKPKQKT